MIQRPYGAADPSTLERDTEPVLPDEAEAIASLLVVAAAAALGLTGLGVSGPLATIAIGGFLVLAPGFAAVRAAGAPAGILAVALAIPLSVGIDGLAAMVLLSTHTYQPALAMLVIVGITLVFVLIERLRRPDL